MPVVFAFESKHCRAHGGIFEIWRIPNSEVDIDGYIVRYDHSFRQIGDFWYFYVYHLVL